MKVLTTIDEWKPTYPKLQNKDFQTRICLG